MVRGLTCLLLFVCAGASCPRDRQLMNDPAPVVLGPNPSLEQVITAVNANSARIQQLQSSGATLKVGHLPALEANYAVDRPRRFRLRAQTRLTGPELDLGSNDQQFWIWVKQSPEPAIYWGQHDQYYRSAAQQILPVPPEWLIEALGIVRLDPTANYEGPSLVENGRIEIRSQVVGPSGPMTRVLVIDDQRGWVLEQHLFDANQAPIASAAASGFQYDPNTGASLPRMVEVHLPPARLSFTLRTEQHLVNQLSGDPAQLWKMPQMSGYPQIEITQPGRAPQPQLDLMARRPRRSVPRPAVHREQAIRRLPPFDRLR